MGKVTDSINAQFLTAVQVLVRTGSTCAPHYRYASASRQRVCLAISITSLPVYSAMAEYGSRVAQPRRCAIRLFAVLIFLFSNLIHAQATEQHTEFATDTDSILRQLVDPQNETTSASKGGLFIKGDINTALEDSKPHSSTSPLTVLQEVEEKGVSTRAFGVVQRQSVAPRANLQILFDTDSAFIRPESYPLLRSLGDALRREEMAGQVMAVNGHTDSTGSDSYNLQLSFERARSVRDYLVNREGIDHARLRVFGFGEGAPLVANDTADNRQKNRRVEIERTN